MIRKARTTKETEISIALDEAQSPGASSISTGSGFFDHMLTLLSFHSGLYMDISAQGDLEVDAHHTVEDVGIILGQIIREIYVSKASYQRYGTTYIPMDESLARVTLDLSGRPHLNFQAQFSKDTVGNFDTELVMEFFNAVSMNSRMTLHIDLLKGGNTHHEIEAIFKAFARSLSAALQPSNMGVPSSKGVIE